MTAAPPLHSPTGAGAPPAGGQIPHPAPSRLRLGRTFGLRAVVLISVIAAASAWLLGRLVTSHLLAQEGLLTRDVVRTLLLVDEPMRAAFDPGGRVPGEAASALARIARLPDVLRANVYDRERRLVWSSDAQLIGRRFGANEELDQALAGEVAVEPHTRAERHRAKDEYEALVQPEALFVEIYVPVVDESDATVLGAIELYKNPIALMHSLATLRSAIALGAAAAGALLFAALYGVVRRADLALRAQEQALVDQETFAVVGELSSVVAHGIRNPLAAIRSSAELILDGAPATPDVAQPAQDIVEQSDRLGRWLRELLSYTQGGSERMGALQLPPLVRSAVAEIERPCAARAIAVELALADDLPAVSGDPLAIGQVLRSVLSNALEALPDGGRIQIGVERRPPGWLTLVVQDDGPGFSATARHRAGQAMFTTKPQGLGVGLALARRVLRRCGGTLEIGDAPGRGARIAIALRFADGS